MWRIQVLQFIDQRPLNPLRARPKNPRNSSPERQINPLQEAKTTVRNVNDTRMNVWNLPIFYQKILATQGIQRYVKQFAIINEQNPGF